jgi:hypothetical protein
MAKPVPELVKRVVTIFQDATLVNESVSVDYGGDTPMQNFDVPAAASEVVATVESSESQHNPVVLQNYIILEPIVRVGYMPDRSKVIAEGVVLIEESDDQCIKLREIRPSMAQGSMMISYRTLSLPRKNMWIDEQSRQKPILFAFDVTSHGGSRKTEIRRYHGMITISYRLPLVAWKFLHTISVSDTRKVAASTEAPYFTKHNASLVTSVKFDVHTAMLNGLVGVMHKINLVNKRLGHASEARANVSYGRPATFAPIRRTMMKMRAPQQEAEEVQETSAAPRAEFAVSQSETLGFWSFENLEFSDLGGVAMAQVRDKMITVHLANTINYSAADGNLHAVSQTLLFSFADLNSTKTKQSETQKILNEIEPGQLQVYIDGLLVTDSLTLTSVSNMFNLGTLPAISLMSEQDSVSVRHNYTQERLVMVNRSSVAIPVVYVSDRDVRRIKRVEVTGGEEAYETREEYKAINVAAEHAAHVFEPILVAPNARLVYIHRLYTNSGGGETES